MRPSVSTVPFGFGFVSDEKVYSLESALLVSFGVGQDGRRFLETQLRSFETHGVIAQIFRAKPLYSDGRIERLRTSLVVARFHPIGLGADNVGNVTTPKGALIGIHACDGSGVVPNIGGAERRRLALCLLHNHANGFVAQLKQIG